MRAELTPVEALRLQLGFAPSQIIPETLPIIFFTAPMDCSLVPPIR